MTDNMIEALTALENLDPLVDYIEEWESITMKNSTYGYVIFMIGEERFKLFVAG